MNYSEIFLVFGDNLFPVHFFDKFKRMPFLMIEGPDLQTHFNYHKLRLTFLQSASRHKFFELKDQGFHVERIYLKDCSLNMTYTDRLRQFCQKHHVKMIHSYGKEDKFFHNDLISTLKEINVEYKTYRSPLFVNTPDIFSEYLSNHKKPFMKTFYESSRKKYNILVDQNQKPVGGKWSFDEYNRRKLDKKIKVPSPKTPVVDHITLEVISEINDLYRDHPGLLLSDGSNFIFPVTRAQAIDWFEQFLEYRFYHFGEYEDALSSDHDFNFHSVLSPLINIGLITPEEVINRSLSFAKANKTPLNSLEGFIRQILGWREFIRGIHLNFSEIQSEGNFFNHHRKLSACWYQGDTGLVPLDLAIKKVHRLGYLHHIERLMVVSNLMLLCEIHPQEVHRWFNEMFVDSMDWVMGPNVFGMGQFSDGGIFATKPYFCGSNYLLKMGDYKKGEWTHEVDALFWSFIYNHREFFLKNYRLSMMVRTIDKMDKAKVESILNLSELVKLRLTS